MGRNTIYGRDELAWGDAVNAVLPFLKATARNKGTTTYTDVNDVVKRHGLAGFDFNRAAERYAVGYLLRLVVLRDHSENPHVRQFFLREAEPAAAPAGG